MEKDLDERMRKVQNLQRDLEKQMHKIKTKTPELGQKLPELEQKHQDTNIFSFDFLKLRNTFKKCIIVNKF